MERSTMFSGKTQYVDWATASIAILNRRLSIHPNPQVGWLQWLQPYLRCHLLLTLDGLLIQLVHLACQSKSAAKEWPYKKWGLAGLGKCPNYSKHLTIGDVISNKYLKVMWNKIPKRVIYQPLLDGAIFKRISPHDLAFYGTIHYNPSNWGVLNFTLTISASRHVADFGMNMLVNVSERSTKTWTLEWFMIYLSVHPFELDSMRGTSGVKRHKS